MRKEVQGNSKAIQTLAQVSYSGWNTAQKLQAVQGGLFPELTGAQKAALVESLRAEHAREQLVAGIQQAAQDFGNLAAIARNIGLPPDAVTALQGAQIVATGIAQFATGNYLGALSSITSLVGLGAPDAAAERHAAMMKYLAQQFEVINKKLDTIIDLQVKTLNAVADLAREQQNFRREVLGQLDRIEDTVLRSERILQAILLNDWKECHSFINGTALNGQFSIANRSILVEIASNSNAPLYAGRCYSTMTSFLDAFVKPARWSGQIIDADNFPNDIIASNPVLHQSWVVFQRQRVRAYTSARDFMLSALPDAPKAPARYLARVAQPVVETGYAQGLDALFGRQEVLQKLDSFRCDQAGVLSQALTDLICFGTVIGSTSPPPSRRWEELLSAGLIGPQSMRLLDTGITLAAVADFGRRKDQGSFDFVRPETIANFAQVGPTTVLRQALAERKGVQLLTKLQWLSEASVLQQSIAYGDYTAELVERALYDAPTKSLNTGPENLTPLKQLALEAMRWNPVLARNVVMLAMRRSIEDSLGGAAKAEGVRYRQTFYHLALRDFKGPQACNGSTLARVKLGELFPNWRFEYRVTADEKQTAPKLKDCPEESKPEPGSTVSAPPFGSGVAVSIGSFYALVPTATVLRDGMFEQTDSLRLALVYRDRVSQAIIDRNVADTVKRLAGNGKDAKTIAGQIAFALLNEGWGWQHRARSN